MLGGAGHEPYLGPLAALFVVLDLYGLGLAQLGGGAMRLVSRLMTQASVTDEHCDRREGDAESPDPSTG